MMHAARNAAAIAIAACAAHAFAAGPITTASLIAELADVHRLAEFPDPVYRNVQYSSYDRRSNLPAGPDWFANSDGFGNEPIPNFEAVLEPPDAGGIGTYLVCDVEGPGAVVRLWSAQIAGELEVTLDGAAAPLYRGPAEPFFQRAYDSFLDGSGLAPADLDGALYQRDASYAPIPFAQRLRIVYRGKLSELHFYEVQLRRYPKGTPVATFAAGDAAANADLLRNVCRTLKDPDAQWSYRSNQAQAAIDATVPAGSAIEVLRTEGAGAIERFTLRLDAADRTRALRETVLRIFADGHPAPQVQAPVGDFFGAAPGINPYVSVPFTVKADGTMTSRFVMPYAKSLSVVLENLGSQTVIVSGSALPMARPWDEARSMHFRARWRIDRDLIGSPDAVQDMPYLIAGGAGLYAGSAAYLLNPNQNAGSWGNWWGEGDEKVFVDDDLRPAIFGTGSEDYFNYSWSSPDLFGLPFCGQPRNDGPGNRGFVANYRWHIVDPIPFRQRIAFYMELFPHERTPGMAYARIAYHYARPGAIDDHLAIVPADIAPLELPDFAPAPRFAFQNTVFFPIEERTRVKVAAAYDAAPLWEGGRAFAWTPLRDGEELLLGIPVRDAGKYTLHLGLGFAPGSGQLAIEPIQGDTALTGEGGVVNLDDPARTFARIHSTGELELAAGLVELKLRHAGGPRRIILDFAALQRR